MKSIASITVVLMVAILAIVLMQVGFTYAEQLNPIQNGQKIAPDGVPADVAVKLEQDAQTKVDALNEREGSIEPSGKGKAAATVTKGGAVAFRIPHPVPTPPAPPEPEPPLLIIYPPSPTEYPGFAIHLPDIPVVNIPPTSFTMILKKDGLHVYIDIFTWDPATNSWAVTTYEYVIPFPTWPSPLDRLLGPEPDLPPGVIVG